MHEKDTPTLQTQAYEALRRALVFSRYKPGERLVPKRLCEELGLGRTPVREALVLLQQQGLVSTVPQSGTYVSKIDMRACEDARFARECLERQVVIECCAKATKADIAGIDAIIAQQEKAVVAADELAFFESDNLMHETFFIIADRAPLWDWLNMGNVHYERFRWLAVLTSGVEWDVVMDQHHKIRDAIAAHDTNEASYLTSRHLRKAHIDYHPISVSHPEYFTES